MKQYEVYKRILNADGKTYRIQEHVLVSKKEAEELVKEGHICPELRNIKPVDEEIVEDGENSI